MIKIVDSERPVTEADLARLEQEMGRPLPQQYREFLLAHNGGRPEPDTIDIYMPDRRIATDVKVFFAIDDPMECCDIFWNLEILEGYKESQYLPIADDSGGLIFVIDLSPETYGQVFYMNMVESVETPYLVARDFNEFLSKLREPTPWELGEEDEPSKPQS